MKSKAAGCCLISTLISSIVLLCVSSILIIIKIIIIIINNNNNNNNNKEFMFKRKSFRAVKKKHVLVKMQSLEGTQGTQRGKNPEKNSIVKAKGKIAGKH